MYHPGCPCSECKRETFYRLNVLQPGAWLQPVDWLLTQDVPLHTLIASSHEAGERREDSYDGEDQKGREAPSATA